MTLRPPTPPNRRDGARRNRRRTSVTALLVLLLTALPWGGAAAHAHASLLSSEPGAGANLATAPETLLLTFNEDVTLLETTRLTGPGGEIPYRAEVDGGLVELRPDVALEDGRWDLVWQIVSADGHLVGGVIPFTVGDAGTQNDPADSEPGAGEASAYTAMAPTEGPYIPDAPGVLDRLLELIGWLAAIAALGVILAERGTLGAALGAGAAAVPLLRIIDAVDRWGVDAWTIGETRAAAAASVAGAVLVVGATLSGRARTGMLTTGVIAWSAQAFLSGHPNVIDPRPLYAALSALHLAGALTWSAAVTATLIDPRLARRASLVATLGVTALLPGAALLLAAFIPPVLGDGAGRWEGILAAKALIVALALGIGWRNHGACRCSECGHHGCGCPVEGEVRRGLRRRSAAETGLIAVVAVLSATLSANVPERVLEARRQVQAGAAGEVATDSRDDAGRAEEARAGVTVDARADLLFENGETGEILFEIEADGTTTIHLVLRDSNGNPFTAEQVAYELEHLELGIVGLYGELPVNGGMHMGETVLPEDGTWRIQVNATYDTFTTISATTEIQARKKAP